MEGVIKITQGAWIASWKSLRICSWATSASIYPSSISTFSSCPIVTGVFWSWCQLSWGSRQDNTLYDSPVHHTALRKAKNLKKSHRHRHTTLSSKLSSCGQFLECGRHQDKKLHTGGQATFKPATFLLARNSEKSLQNFLLTLFFTLGYVYRCLDGKGLLSNMSEIDWQPWSWTTWCGISSEKHNSKKTFFSKENLWLIWKSNDLNQ